MTKTKVTLNFFWGLRFKKKFAGAALVLGEQNEKIKGIRKFAVN